MKSKQKPFLADVGKKAPESSEELKGLCLERTENGLQRYLKNNGIDLKSLTPKMEKYKSILKWNEDSIAYQQAKIEVLKSAAELYNTLGGKAADFQTEIMRLSYMIDLLEKKLLEEGRIPIESKSYMAAIKIKKELLTEYTKLNLDYSKADTDYKYKKAQQPEMDDNIFVYKGEE